MSSRKLGRLGKRRRTRRIIFNTVLNAKKAHPLVQRIPQYRIKRLQLLKCRKINCPIPLAYSTCIDGSKWVSSPEPDWTGLCWLFLYTSHFSIISMHERKQVTTCKHFKFAFSKSRMNYTYNVDGILACKTICFKKGHTSLKKLNATLTSEKSRDHNGLIT